MNFTNQDRALADMLWPLTIVGLLSLLGITLFLAARLPSQLRRSLDVADPTQRKLYRLVEAHILEPWFSFGLLALPLAGARTLPYRIETQSEFVSLFMRRFVIALPGSLLLLLPLVLLLVIWQPRRTLEWPQHYRPLLDAISRGTWLRLGVGLLYVITMIGTSLLFGVYAVEAPSVLHLPHVLQLLGYALLWRKQQTIRAALQTLNQAQQSPDRQVPSLPPNLREERQS